MKKTGILIALGLFIVLRTSASFAAVDLSIGGTAWYIWWNPAWADAKTTTTLYKSDPALYIEDAHDFKPASNVMGGPMLSIGFLNRWSIQSVFTIGRFRYFSNGLTKDRMIQFTGYGDGGSYRKYTRSTLKWDSDTSIGCAINRVVRIFAGFKSQGYRYHEYLRDILFSDDTAMYTRTLTDDVKAYGCGLGLGLTIPLVTDFYMMMSASGLTLWSKEKIRVNNWRSVTVSTMNGFDLLPLMPGRGTYFSYGGTASLSFAYVIEKINTTLSFGGRYQLLFNRQRYNDLVNNDVAMNIIDKQYDHFFGITLSAVYTFHIGKKG